MTVHADPSLAAELPDVEPQQELPPYTPSNNSQPPSEKGATPPVEPHTHPEQGEWLSAEQEKEQWRLSQSDGSDTHPLYRSASPPPEVILPTVDGPGHATIEALTRGLQVPSRSSLATSGFPYPGQLASYGVTMADWAKFTAEITNAARLSPSDVLVSIGGGAGTLIVSGLFIGWFAVIPALFAGRVIHRKLSQRNLVKARQVGELESKLLKWNQDFFAPRGLLIRLDLPGECYDLQQMDVQSRPSWKLPKRTSCGSRCSRAKIAGNDAGAFDVEVESEKPQRKQEKAALKAGMKEYKCAVKEQKRDMKIRRKAARKGRIVIIPLNKKPLHDV